MFLTMSNSSVAKMMQHVDEVAQPCLVFIIHLENASRKERLQIETFWVFRDLSIIFNSVFGWTHWSGLHIQHLSPVFFGQWYRMAVTAQSKHREQSSCWAVPIASRVPVTDAVVQDIRLGVAVAASDRCRIYWILEDNISASITCTLHFCCTGITFGIVAGRQKEKYQGKLRRSKGDYNVWLFMIFFSVSNDFTGQKSQ